jgi:hypothetical protein
VSENAELNKTLRTSTALLTSQHHILDTCRTVRPPTGPGRASSPPPHFRATLIHLRSRFQNGASASQPPPPLLIPLTLSRRTNHPDPPSLALLQSAIFDFPSLLTVILLLICTFAYLRAQTANWVQDPAKPPGTMMESSRLDSYKHGMLGTAWKFARIGERASPWVAVSCVCMAVHLLLR